MKHKDLPIDVAEPDSFLKWYDKAIIVAFVLLLSYLLAEVIFGLGLI